MCRVVLDFIRENCHDPAESLERIHDFQYSLSHTLNIPKVLHDDSRFTNYFKEKVAAANKIIAWIRNNHWHGIITTDIQRAPFSPSHSLSLSPSLSPSFSLDRFVRVYGVKSMALKFKV